MTTFPRNYQTESRTVICVVRWFVLGNCFNYGPAPFFFSVVPPIPSPILPPQLAGIWIFNQPDFLDDPKYRVDPDGQVCHFEDHFTQMLKEFQKAQMQVIPSIIDFHALLDRFPGERAPGLKNRARGRGDIAEDKKKRDPVKLRRGCQTAAPAVAYRTGATNALMAAKLVAATY